MTSAGRPRATTVAWTPNGSVIVAPGVCPDGKPASIGPAKPSSTRRTASAPRTSPPGSSQPGSSLKTMAAGAADDAGLDQLRQQPIEPVRPLVHLVEEQDAAGRRVERERRPERGRELGDGAADEHARGLALAPDLEAGRHQRAHRLGDRHGAHERVAVVAGAIGEAAFQHRAVEAHEAASLLQPRVDRRDVAVADEHLGRRRDRGGIEQRQDLGAAVAAAGADDAGDGGIRERLLEVRGTQRGVAGEVAAGLRPHAIVHRDLEALALELEHAASERPPRAHGLAGATMAIRSPGRSARRLEQSRPAGRPAHSHCRISSATSWCSNGASASSRSGSMRRPAAAQEPRLRPAHPRHGVLDALGEPHVALGLADDRFERADLLVVVAVADEEAVAAGAQAAHHRLLDRVAVGDRLHVEVVGDHRAAVAELVLEHRLHDARRQRRRVLVVDLGEEHVAGEHAGHVGGDRLAERHELDGTQPIRRQLADRQVQVRVDAGVAVPGEVLARRGEAGALERLDQRPPQRGDVLDALREGAVADGRVLRVGQDVEDRREIERDADREQLRGHRPGEARGERRVLGPAERDHRRPARERLLQPLDAAALLVDAEPERRLLAQRLAGERELGHLRRRLDVAREDDQPAEVELARDLAHLGRQGQPVEAADQQLADVGTDVSQRHAW